MSESDRDDHLDGELVDDQQLPAERRGQQLAEQRHTPPQNPFDADPAAFKQVITQRQANKQALVEWLRSNLRRGVHFGRMHVMPKKKCPDGNRCTIDWHYSGLELWAPGGDVILSLLGLATSYKGEDDYRQALLRGVAIQEIMLTAYIVNGAGQVMAEGTGSASLGEHGGSFHNALAKAQKRARLAATKRLPGVSSLFEDGDASVTGDDLERSAAQQRPEREPGGRPPRSRYDTGRIPETLPFKIGDAAKGTPFSQLDGKLLAWIVEKMANKPDITQAARQELDRRRLQEPEPEGPTGAPEKPQEQRSTRDVQPPDDDPEFSQQEAPRPGAGLFDDGPDPDTYFR